VAKRNAGKLDIAGLRLANQHLAKQSLQTASEVVSRLGAVQAQDYAGAKWGIALRAIGVTDADVEREISEGKILRTHILRPTWHFVAAADLRWMLELTAPRVRAAVGSYDRKLGIDVEVRRQTRNVLTQTLRGGNHLTRGELAEELTKNGVRTDGTQRLAHLMIHAELDGLICSGARRGKQFTYRLVDECVPPTKYLMRDVALRELATRYFTTRGPATEDDFAWWSGLTKADARGAVNSVENVESEIVGGRTYWFVPNRVSSTRIIANLLPAYDEYLVSYADRSATQKRVKPRTVGETFSFLGSYVIVVGGQIVGRWKSGTAKEAVTLRFEPLTRLTRAELDAVEDQAKRFAKYLGQPVQTEMRKRASTRTL
jgi:Winged helix DNA-binding domain